MARQVRPWREDLIHTGSQELVRLFRDPASAFHQGQRLCRTKVRMYGRNPDLLVHHLIAWQTGGDHVCVKTRAHLTRRPVVRYSAAHGVPLAVFALYGRDVRTVHARLTTWAVVSRPLPAEHAGYAGAQRTVVSVVARWPSIESTSWSGVEAAAWTLAESAAWAGRNTLG